MVTFADVLQNGLCQLPIHNIVIRYPNRWYKWLFVTCCIHITNGVTNLSQACFCHPTVGNFDVSPSITLHSIMDNEAANCVPFPPHPGRSPEKRRPHPADRRRERARYGVGDGGVRAASVGQSRAADRGAGRHRALPVHPAAGAHRAHPRPGREPAPPVRRPTGRRQPAGPGLRQHEPDRGRPYEWGHGHDGRGRRRALLQQH